MCGYLQQLQGLAVMQKSVECEGPQCHTSGCSLVLLSYTVLNMQSIILHFSMILVNMMGGIRYTYTYKVAHNVWYNLLCQKPQLRGIVCAFSDCS